MVRAMRIVNILIIALIIAGSVRLVMQNLAEPAMMVGNFIGIAFMAGPFYLSWRGLCPTSTLRAARSARLVNSIVGALIVLGLLLLLVSSDDVTTAIISASSEKYVGSFRDR